jgi:hypothetical protein
MRPLTTLAVAALLSATLSATAFIAMRTPGRIVLAADEARTALGKDGTLTVSTGLCKIRRAGPWWVVFGGYEGSGHGDVYATIVRAVTQAGTLREAVGAVETLLAGDVRAAFTREATRPHFDAMYTRGQSILAVIVAGVDHGVLSVGYVGLTYREDHPVETVTCPPSCSAGVPFRVAGSAANEAREAILNAPHPWLDKADAAAGRSFIARLITASDLVRPPIDVLQVDASGAHWIDRDPASTCGKE